MMNTGTRPNLTRADIQFANGRTYRNVDRLDELRWTIAGSSSDIVKYQKPGGGRA